MPVKPLTPSGAQAALLQSAPAVDLLARSREELSGALCRQGFVLQTTGAVTYRPSASEDQTSCAGSVHLDPLSGQKISAWTCLSVALTPSGKLGATRLWHRIGGAGTVGVPLWGKVDCETVDFSHRWWDTRRTRETVPAWLRRLSDNLEQCEKPPSRFSVAASASLTAEAYLELMAL